MTHGLMKLKWWWNIDITIEWFPYHPWDERYIYLHEWLIPWDWYIYLHDSYMNGCSLLYGFHVGKYTSPMDNMIMGPSYLGKIHRVRWFSSRMSFVRLPRGVATRVLKQHQIQARFVIFSNKVGPEPHEWLEKDLRLLEMVWISGNGRVCLLIFFGSN